MGLGKSTPAGKRQLFSYWGLTMSYLFSAYENAFFPTSLKHLYIDAGTWPDDGTEVSDEIFQVYSAMPPPGKIRGVVNGMPAWVDLPEPTYEELLKLAEQQRQLLIDDAMQSLAVIQLKLQAGRKLTGEETLRLNHTLDYIDEVEATDISTVPDISWPASQA